MHRSESEELASCANCQAEISTIDRTYSFGEGEVLCFACAVARGGSYDEAHDRWLRAPNLEGLRRAHLESW